MKRVLTMELFLITDPELECLVFSWNSSKSQAVGAVLASKSMWIKLCNGFTNPGPNAREGGEKPASSS